MLYNAERPHKFDQIIGQRLVVENIRNQSKRESFFPVFVLCGQYGSGKTTMARIIAMAANCLHKDADGNPCGECDSCRAVLEHSPEGIIEIDGASNNGVDNVRSLIKQASSLGLFRKKVIVIDEAHMLSRQAFNALLITLENPPEHCIFILCTTEKDALPETVISRAPVYVFGKIEDTLIKEHILNVAARNGIVITDDAAGLLSRYVNGAMRNALQLLEFLSLQSEEGITEELVTKTLGISSMEQRAAFLEGCLSGDLSMIIGGLKQLERQGMSLRTFVQDVLSMNTDVLMVKSGAEVVGTSFYRRELKNLSDYPEVSLVETSRILSKIASTPAEYLSLERIVADIVSVMYVPCDPVSEIACKAMKKEDKRADAVLDEWTKEMHKPFGGKKPEDVKQKQDKQEPEKKTSEEAVSGHSETVAEVKTEEAGQEEFSSLPEDMEIPFETVPEDAKEEPEETSDEEDLSFDFFDGGFFGGGLFDMGAVSEYSDKKKPAKKEEADFGFLGMDIPEEGTLQPAEAVTVSVPEVKSVVPEELPVVEPELPFEETGMEEEVTAAPVMPFDEVGVSEVKEEMVAETMHAPVTETPVFVSRTSSFSDSVPIDVTGRITWDEAAAMGLVPDSSTLRLPVPETDEQLNEMYKELEAEAADDEEDPDDVKFNTRADLIRAQEALSKLLKNPGFKILFNKARYVEKDFQIYLCFESAALVAAAKAFIKTSGSEGIQVVHDK